MTTTRFTPLDRFTRRTTDLNPAGGADDAYPQVGKNWQQPSTVQPGATFNDTEPAAWEPDETASQVVTETAEEVRSSFRFVVSVIVLALVVAGVFIVLSIMEAAPK